MLVSVGLLILFVSSLLIGLDMVFYTYLEVLSLQLVAKVLIFSKSNANLLKLRLVNYRRNVYENNP